MSGIRTASTARPWRGATLVALLATLLAAGACAPKASRRQTDIMEKTGTVGVSTAVLRVGVNDLVDRFAGRIEQSADRVVEQADTAAVRQRALAFKVDAVPVVYTAGFRADPLSAAIDVWVLAFQFREYVETGAGQAAFGPQKPVLEEAARAQLADVDAVMRTIAIKPEHFDRARPQVERWAAGHPIAHTFAGRTSGASLLTRLRSDNKDAFLVVGDVSDTLENVAERLNTYAAHLPKQARWQAELLATDMTTALRLDRTVADVHDVGTAARHATGVLEGMPALLDAQRDLLGAERRAVLAGIDGQRQQTLAFLTDYMTDERLALVGVAREERVATLAALQQERLATIAAVDAMRKLTVDSSLVGLRELVDYTIWRVAMLVAGLMILGLVLGVLAVRLTIGHGTGASGDDSGVVAHGLRSRPVR
jgi:hypothetical protein